jgi:hypothetical protein
MPQRMVEASMRLFAAEVLPTIRTFGRPELRAVSYHTVLRGAEDSAR